VDELLKSSLNIVLLIQSTPIVDLESSWKTFFVYLLMMQVLPTPELPNKITLNDRGLGLITKHFINEEKKIIHEVSSLAVVSV
jgi:hypothetical protein